MRATITTGNGKTVEIEKATWAEQPGSRMSRPLATIEVDLATASSLFNYGSLVLRMADGREAQVFMQNFVPPAGDAKITCTLVCEKIIRAKPL